MRSSVSLLLALVSSMSAAFAAEAAYNADQLRELLSRPPKTGLIPELDSADPAALAARPLAKALLDAAAKPMATIPDTTYTAYRLFRTTGDRKVYEKAYFDKRDELSTRAMAAWLTGDDAQLPAVNDLLWNICEETTWVLPAHENDKPWNIDLFAAETGSELAHVLLLLGDRLPEEVRNRVRDEVRTRVLDPYLQHAEEYGWRVGANNWTGVCAGSVGQAFLILEPDVDRQARALLNVLVQLDRFKNGAFEEDGASLEGIGYWNYGLLHYVGFGEMLRARTDGAIDLLADPKLVAIAKYPGAVALDRHVFASFSDSHEESAIAPYLAARIAERTGVETVLGQAADENSRWRLGTKLRNVLWVGDAPAREAIIESAYLPNSAVIKLVGSADGARIVLAAKAGHNNEPHNQNDVGSFILRAGGTTYLCDPGGGLYSRDYFGPKRYENVFANSYGHSVPRIGGKLQQAGAQFRGTMERLADNAVRIDMAGAYGIPELKRAARTLTLQPDGAVAMDAEYAFEGAGLEVEEALVTWLPVEVEGSVARITSPEGALTIRAAAGTFAVERLQEASRANAVNDKTLSRITLALPPAPELRARYTFTYIPLARP